MSDAITKIVNIIAEYAYTNGYPKWAAAIFIIILSVFLATVTRFIIDRYISRLTKLTQTEIDDEILDAVKAPIYYLILLVGFLIAINYIQIPYYDYFVIIVSIILIIIAAQVISKTIEIVLTEFSMRMSSKEVSDDERRSTIDIEAIPFIIRITKLSIFIIAFLIITKILFNIDINSIVVGLGLFSIGIGFAAKDTFANLFAGFFILLDRPFVRGERIEIQNYVGDVIDIGLRTTKIKTLTDKVVIVPNALMVSDIVVNYVLPRKKVQLREIYGVAYGSDIDKVMEVLLEAADECDYIYKKPKPEVYFVKFNDYSLDFELRIWLKDYHENKGRGA
ncbi:MAG: hypothetical protein CVT90_01405, partial [Candidatus Altiarchaeales archaeon HGW-Altiarchaeales-3]